MMNIPHLVSPLTAGIAKSFLDFLCSMLFKFWLLSKEAQYARLEVNDVTKTSAVAILNYVRIPFDIYRWEPDGIMRLNH